MSNLTNIKAILLRVNCDHDIKCSAAQEKKLVSELEKLWNESNFSKNKVLQVVSDLPTTFFSENKLDSTHQYANLLWDALSVDAKELTSASSTNVTHFHGSVQTQILQTGANSKAKISQRSQQNQSYSETMGVALKELRDVIDAEIVDEHERKKALAIVSDAQQEAAKPNADKSKVQKCLKSIAKWTGGRLTKAVDAAIDVGVKYTLMGPTS